MNDIDVIRSWKRPGTRTGDAADHPAGEIRLPAGSRLTRRTDLLSGGALSSARYESYPTFTQTGPCSFALAESRPEPPR